MQRMETRRYLWICSPVTRIPHIWWRLCRRSWFVLPCYANCKVVLCFVSAGPQTETSSRANSCSRISHTSKHSVETAYTKWYKCANLHIICAGFPAGFEQCATAHIHITQTTEHRVLCTLLLCSSGAAVRFVSNIHISLICIQGPSRCERFRP